MRYLFLHPVFPGQFTRVMEALARDPANEVVHCSRESAVRSIAGVRKVRYPMPTAAAAGVKPHAFLQRADEALQQGLAVLKVVQQLRQEGFVPDLIYGYAGWGPTLFMKDVFPQTPLLGYFEWFLNPFGSEYNFDPAHPLAFDAQLGLRMCNANMLLDLQACDHGVTPTHWQRQQFPEAFRSRLSVLHDGVDTEFYRPAPVDAADARQALSSQVPALDLTHADEVITCATRGMEPFRGFPQFMRALAAVQRRRPGCHAVIVGTEAFYYSRAPQGAANYKAALLDELRDVLDLSRIHFVGWLDAAAYREVLRVSSAHVYLTYPYVLSWSLLEAMATGCLVIGSRTAPVEEVVRDGDNGWLVDFFDHTALANRIEEALVERHSPRVQALRDRARQTVLERYALDRVLPRHLALVQYQALNALG